MKLTDKTDYALRIIIFLIENNKKVKIQEIADYYKIPKNHLKVIVNQLSVLGFIQTTTGPNGGIQLKIESLPLGLGDFVLKFENMDLVECFNPESNTCHISKRCKLKNILHKANQNFINTLNQYQVKDLLP